jgi:hypothetical protein
LLPPTAESFCDVLDRPPVESVLSFELDVLPEIVEPGVGAVVVVVGVVTVFVASAEWLTAAVSATARPTPAAAVPPPASAASRTRRLDPLFSSMPTTIGRGASGRPHRKVKVVLTLPGFQ